MPKNSKMQKTKRILTIFPYANHIPLMRNYRRYLADKGVRIDIFNTTDWFFEGDASLPPIVGLLRKVKRLPGRIFNSLIMRGCNTYALDRLVCGYDVIDVHTFSSFYTKCFPRWTKAGKRIKVTPWGSDILRADTASLARISASLRFVEEVTLAEPMYAFFLATFSQFKGPVVKANFGITNFDAIISRLPEERSILKEKWFGTQNGKKRIVTIGYNGSVHQRHTDVLRALQAVGRDEIHLVVPFSYGGEHGYRERLNEALDAAGFTYTLIDRYVSTEKIVELRLITDIMVNIQLTDAFSASIQEHVVAGNVCVIGSWLPYVGFFHEKGIFVVDTSLDNLQENLERTIRHYPTYKTRSENNTSILYGINSWSEAIVPWAVAFKHFDHENR